MRMTIALAAVAAVATLASAANAQPPGGRGGPAQTPEQREAAFTAADANKDGKLDKAEFKTSLGERAAQLDATMLDGIFGRRDTNMDGSISKEEFLSNAGMGGRGGGGRGQ